MTGLFALFVLLAPQAAHADFLEDFGKAMEKMGQDFEKAMEKFQGRGDQRQPPPRSYRGQRGQDHGGQGRSRQGRGSGNWQAIDGGQDRYRADLPPPPRRHPYREGGLYAGSQGQSSPYGQRRNPYDYSDQPVQPQTRQQMTPEQRFMAALTDAERLKKNIAAMERRMARIFHQIRVSQKAIGAQYVAVGRAIAQAHSTYRNAMLGSGVNGQAALLPRLASASQGTQQSIGRITTYAIRYESEPDLKDLVLQAHRNTLQISALKGAVERLRQDYREIFSGVTRDLEGVDPASFRGGVGAQQSLLRQVSVVTDSMTTPLIRTTTKSRLVLSDVAQRYRRLETEMTRAIRDFERAGEEFAIQAGKQAAILAALIAKVSTTDTDNAWSVVTGIVAGVMAVDRGYTLIEDLRRFNRFYNWFDKNSQAIVQMNREVRAQADLAVDAIGGVVTDIRRYRREVTARLDRIYAGQETALQNAAKEFQAAARAAQRAGERDAQREKGNLAESVQSNFPFGQAQG